MRALLLILAGVVLTALPGSGLRGFGVGIPIGADCLAIGEKYSCAFTCVPGTPTGIVGVGFNFYSNSEFLIRCGAFQAGCTSIAVCTASLDGRAFPAGPGSCEGWEDDYSLPQELAAFCYSGLP